MKLICTLQLMFLNFFDAMTTVVLFSRGGKELNPLMDKLLNIDPALFFNFKIVVGTGLIILLHIFAKSVKIIRWVVLLYLLIVAANFGQILIQDLF
jgi:hypothetical protein